MNKIQLHVSSNLLFIQVVNPNISRALRHPFFQWKLKSDMARLYNNCLIIKVVLILQITHPPAHQYADPISLHKKYSRLSIIRNPRDYKKNSNYRDFELSRGKKKILIIKSFYYIFENMYELHKFYV